jgi:hypothetical protein
LTANITTANVVSLNVTGDANVANLNVRSNLYTSNIIMSSNLSTNTGYGNVYLTGNLVVAGNIYSVGGSVGSGSGTSQGILYSLPGNYTLGTAFASGSAGPTMNGYHINMASFTAEAVASVSAFTAATGMLKFLTGGLYQLTCVIVGDQPVVKVAVGKTSSSSFPPSVTATAGYEYVYNFPVNSSPSELITIPLTVQDVTQYYYLDVFFSTAVAAPTVLYPTRSTTAAGTNYGTYIQVGPFGNYLTSATGVAAGLLLNCYGTTTLSAPVTSNTFRLAMTSSNGWTVNGTSTSLAVTSGGNFQASQVGIYEVSMCLNPSVTPMMFGVGSLASDTAPAAQGPYIYQYAPMYTQDPTTIVTLPLNITDTSKYYYIDVIFPGTQSTVALSNVSTFVSLKPVGSYVSPSTNPWNQQGTTVYYSNGAVAIGGVTPSLLTETFTVNGNTSFIGNVTVTSDASSNNYVLARRTPAGSLDVTQYVTGRVPLNTTTNLIQNYLSNAAAILANTSTGTITQVLWVPGASTANTGVNMGNGTSVRLSNLATSNLFIEMWVNLSGLGRFQNLFSRQNAAGPGVDIGFYINNTNQITFYVSNATALVTASTSGTISSAGSWVHLSASYVRTSATQGTLYSFIGGSPSTGASFGAAGGSQANLTSTSNIYLFHDVGGSAYFSGNVADVRIMTGSIVPVATFTPQAAPFTTAPTYRTGMDTGYTSNLTMALNSQYFPGASTSPYGPCLTLPGTVGSYYSAVNTAYDTNWSTSGFTLEAWVNYASLANANIYAGVFTFASQSTMITHAQPASNSLDWGFGALTNGALGFYYYITSGYPGGVLTGAGALTTGSWNHVVVQSDGTNIYMFINGTQRSDLTVQGYTNTGTSSAVSISSNVSIAATAGNPISVGQYNSGQGANFALAKARLVFGTAGSLTTRKYGNVYSAGSFTANPNFATVPTGATVAWQLESQFPLPTYPSIQDVTPLALQSGAYGAVPTPVGGVTSNTIGPLTAYPAFDSIRFDGTGYIDYGNAASSAMNSNLWASPWTIEAWVYPTSVPSSAFVLASRTAASSTDFALAWDSTSVFYFSSNSGSTKNYGSRQLSVGSWTHVAVTFDGTNSNVYVGGLVSNTMAVSAIPQLYTPTNSFQIGTQYSGSSPGLNWNGNLADLRVSNVARYTGSSYTVPTAPFSTDSSTLLLLKSLGGQVGTTLEVQGRGLNSTSIGAGRVTQSYPPAPMSSYLLDTTSNASVTYGQGKYVASASSEYSGGASGGAYLLFDYNSTTDWASAATYSSAGVYTGSVTTVDLLGNSYLGEWVQLQTPVSVILTTYTLTPNSGQTTKIPAKFWILGSRDGVNWSLVNSQSGLTWSTTAQTFVVGATQGYNFYRLVINQISGAGTVADFAGLLFNGTEEGFCISSDSKTGVGIANPQRSLEVAGDLVVSGTISGGAGMGSFRNRIINGDMRIAQRGTSNVMAASAISALYGTVDRFAIYSSITSGSITSTQQTLTASDNPYQLGLRYSWRLTTTVPLVIGYFLPTHTIEGLNIADFMWGTSFGQPVTMSFWLRSNITNGSIIHISFRNGSASYSYNAPVIVTNGGGWQYVTFTVPPPPNGSTWASDNTAGIYLGLGAVNSAAYSTTPNVWQSGNYMGVSGYTPWWNNAGNYIEFTGVQLEKGTIATPFEVRPYATELQLCQRYYETGTSSVVFTVSGAAQTTSSSVFYKVTKRSTTTPVLTGQAYYNSSGGGQAGTPSFYTTSTDSFNIQLNTNAATWGQLVWNVPSEL